MAPRTHLRANSTMTDIPAQMLCPQCGNLSVNEIACDVCGSLISRLANSPPQRLGNYAQTGYSYPDEVRAPTASFFPGLTIAASAVAITALIVGLLLISNRQTGKTSSSTRVDSIADATQQPAELVAEEGPRHSLAIHVRQTPANSMAGKFDRMASILKNMSESPAQRRRPSAPQTQVELAMPAPPAGSPAATQIAKGVGSAVNRKASRGSAGSPANAIDLGEEMFRTGGADREVASAPAAPDYTRREFAQATALSTEQQGGTGDAHVSEISSGTFSSEVLSNSGTPVLVDFYATWCGPCKRLAPTVEQIASEFGSQLKVVRVDGDSNAEVMRRYNVHAFPTLVLFKGGREINRTVGVVPIEVIRQNVQKSL